MITLRNLEKFYEGGYGRSYVLRRINLEIQQGDFVTIMGPSGAGKSTLLSILGMLDGAWTGEFEFVGHEVHRMKPRERVELNKKYIGFVFQSYHLIDNLTVYENLDIPLSYRNVKSSERAALVCDALGALDVPVRQRNVQVLVDRQVVDQVVALEDEADILLVQLHPLAGFHAVDLMAHKLEFPRPGAVQHPQDAEKSGFPRPGRTH